MKCKKCGYGIDKSWQTCPMCAESIKKKNKSIIKIVFITILSFIIISSIYNSINNYISTGERGVKRELEKKYNEKFDKIDLIETTKNPDTSLSCDGANFGTIKGKGDIEYYTVYSKQNDIEFAVYYDTHTKQYQDTYQYSLDLRKSVQQLYEKTKNTFSSYNVEITFSPNIHDEYKTPVTIYLTQDLYNILSNVTDGYPQTHSGSTYTQLSIHVNTNSLQFCKTEYDNIVMLNNYLIELQHSTELYSQIGLYIYTLDGVTLEFNRLDDTVYVYDEHSTGKAWGETINEFIKRESY